MSDKNKTPEEDYLDSLLRSITGGAEEEEIDENFIEEDMDFDKEANGMSEDEFLSDFEKEFFGADIAEVSSLEEPTMQAQVPNIDEAIAQEVQSFAGPMVQEEIPEISIPTFEEPVVQESMPIFEEPVVQEPMPTFTEPVVQEEKPSFDELLPEDIPTFDEPVTEEVKMPEFDLAEDIMNVSDEQAMVEEAIAKEDSSVEADLQGLYGILGMGTEAQELPGDIELEPKKKKGLFSKKDKKERKKKDKKKKGEEEEVANNLVIEGEGIEDFDFSDFSLDALDGGAAGGMDTSEGAFDVGALSEAGSENSGLGLEFDDSIFGAFDDGGSGEEPVFDEDPFADDEPYDEEAELKAKKKQEKKEAKEKKKKEKELAKKEKEKEKKKKAKKQVAKPKKAKEPDEIIKISPIFIIFALSFIVIVILVVKIGGDYYNYNERFYKAISLYVYGNDLEEGEKLDQEAYESKFADAYDLIYGMEMKEKDHQVFYDQLTTIMLMDCHYEAYKSFMLNKDFPHGLDSLVKAVKMYDKYQNDARELKCFDEMTVVLGWVENKLTETYGISLSQARELSMIKDDDEYAVIVREIAAKAEAEYKKNNVDEE